MRSLLVLLPFFAAGCQTSHTITLKPDRSVVVRNSTTCTAMDVREHYASPAIQLMDTSVFGSSIMVITDIDSLGNHLTTYNKGQFNFSLRGDELTVRAGEAALKKCWSTSYLTLFVEQGIEGVTANERFKLDGAYAHLRIRRKVLKNHPEELGAVFLLKPLK